MAGEFIQNTRVLLEDVRHDVKAVAEEVSLTNEKLDRFREEVDQKIAVLDTSVMRIKARLSLGPDA